MCARVSLYRHGLVGLIRCACLNELDSLARGNIRRTYPIRREWLILRDDDCSVMRIRSSLNFHGQAMRIHVIKLD